MLHYSPLLTKACVRQVVLDKRFPLSTLGARSGTGSAACLAVVGRASATGPARNRLATSRRRRATLGWHYLSNATCMIQASFVLCVCFRVKGHHHLLHGSPLLKKSWVRQVALDKWFPLTTATAAQAAARNFARSSAERRDGARRCAAWAAAATSSMRLVHRRYRGCSNRSSHGKRCHNASDAWYLCQSWRSRHVLFDFRHRFSLSCTSPYTRVWHLRSAASTLAASADARACAAALAASAVARAIAAALAARAVRAAFAARTRKRLARKTARSLRRRSARWATLRSSARFWSHRALVHLGHFQDVFFVHKWYQFQT